MLKTAYFFFILSLMLTVGVANASSPDNTVATESTQARLRPTEGLNPLQGRLLKTEVKVYSSCKKPKLESGYDFIELDAPGGQDWQLVVNQRNIQPLNANTIRIKTN